MKILHISKYDSRGGAAIAARNAVLAQRAAGHDARMLVGRQLTDQAYVQGPGWWGDKVAILRFAIERLPMLLTGTPPTETRSIGLSGINPVAAVGRFDPDIIVLHNIDGLLRIEDIARLPAPVIWRLHDMWAFSGTAHYDGGSWAKGPARLAKWMSALDAWVLRRKQRLLANNQITLVPPSHWLGKAALNADPTLDGRVCVIPNGIDSSEFSPQDQGDARAALGLLKDRFVIVFGAASGTSDLRKGFDLLVEALSKLPAEVRNMVQLVTFGGHASDSEVAGIECKGLGRISDRQRLRTTYSAADMVIVPSREENLSLTVLEALACGTPVAAFDIGGMPDMITHGKNGWLIPAFDTAALAKTIEVAAQSRSDLAAYRVAARATVENGFSREIETQQMIALFEKILSAN